jgi:hypothetical protein
MYGDEENEQPTECRQDSYLHVPVEFAIDPQLIGIGFLEL